MPRIFVAIVVYVLLVLSRDLKCWDVLPIVYAIAPEWRIERVDETNEMRRKGGMR